MKRPAVTDVVRVADQNSEYRNKTGTVVSGPTGQYFTVQLAGLNKPVRLRFTQLKLVTAAAPRTNQPVVVGNDPDGRPLGALTTPTYADRRDVLGAGYNPSAASGTLGDTRPPLA